MKHKQGLALVCATCTRRRGTQERHLGHRWISTRRTRQQYGEAPEYTLVVAGGDTDIKPVPAIELEARIRRAH